MAFCKKKRHEIYGKFGGRCAYCGKEITQRDMQIDHIVPKSFGGSDMCDNLNPACRECNYYKHNFSIDEFRNELARCLPKRPVVNLITRLALRYDVLVQGEEWDGKFYFEKQQISGIEKLN